MFNNGDLWQLRQTSRLECVTPLRNHNRKSIVGTSWYTDFVTHEQELPEHRSHGVDGVGRGRVPTVTLVEVTSLVKVHGHRKPSADAQDVPNEVADGGQDTG